MSGADGVGASGEAQEQAAFDAFMQRTAPKAWKAEYDLAREAWMERARGVGVVDGQTVCDQTLMTGSKPNE